MTVTDMRKFSIRPVLEKKDYIYSTCYLKEESVEKLSNIYGVSISEAIRTSLLFLLHGDTEKLINPHLDINKKNGKVQSYNVTRKMRKKIEDLSKKTGISISGIIASSVDHFIELNEKGKIL
jgi:hypothetical protein